MIVVRLNTRKKSVKFDEHTLLDKAVDETVPLKRDGVFITLTLKGKDRLRYELSFTCSEWEFITRQ